MARCKTGYDAVGNIAGKEGPMQSSMLHFCDECGAANAEDSEICAVCQQPLAKPEQAAPIAAVKVAPTPQLQVVASTSVSTEPLKAGDLVAGRYRIVREVGQGGFGAVYQARDTEKHDRLVALKRIDLSLLKPREIIEATDAFNREITFLSTLSHPSLPKIYDHFTDPDHWYLVMQYIEGQTLEERLKRSRKGYLPISQVLKIGMALTNVLGYLHTRRPPVIFRDLKPANIMLTRTGRVYLIDFGIARRFAPEKKRDTGPLGSPGYAAPEQYGTAQTDARSDIYALGATLQTLITGREPLELRQGLLSRRTKPLPAELEALIASMQEADPKKRPRQVTQIEERFAWWARHLPDPRSLIQGTCIGLFFWILYGLFGWGVDVINHTDFSHVSATPFKVRVFLMALGCFPAVIFLTIVSMIILLVRQKKPQLAICVLALFVLMFIFAWLGWLPALFTGYPFHTYNPDLSQ